MSALTEQLHTRWLQLADSLADSAYSAPFGAPLDDWRWGSAGDLLSAGVVLLEANRLRPSANYRHAASACLQVALGYNPTGYSWVTGFGKSSPLHPHHRASASDGVAPPVPGFVVGGPNRAQQDRGEGVRYRFGPGEHPMLSYVDQTESYASNEVCLNWNAPLVYVLGML